MATILNFYHLLAFIVSWSSQPFGSEKPPAHPFAPLRSAISDLSFLDSMGKKHHVGRTAWVFALVVVVSLCDSLVYVYFV